MLYFLLERWFIKYISSEDEQSLCSKIKDWIKNVVYTCKILDTRMEDILLNLTIYIIFILVILLKLSSVPVNSLYLINIFSQSDLLKTYRPKNIKYIKVLFLLKHFQAFALKSNNNFYKWFRNFFNRKVVYIAIKEKSVSKL